MRNTRGDVAANDDDDDVVVEDPLVKSIVVTNNNCLQGNSFHFTKHTHITGYSIRSRTGVPIPITLWIYASFIC